MRYDVDDGGNNPGFTHPLIPEPRKKDTNDIQPRLSFSWDPSSNGSNVIRAGVGMFNGRYLLVPAFTELQQNGVTGRLLRTRLNGALLGLNVPPFVLDPNNPRNTGILLAPDITLLAPDLETPESVQGSLGWTHRFGASRFFFDTEGVWAEGDNEIVIRDINFNGNSNPMRPIRTYNQVNMYTNDGRSEYKALILRLNGTLRQSDLITASVTFADKKNIADDFSPVFRQLSLRLAKSFRFFSDQRLDVIAEAFNLTDATNYDVNSIDTAQFLSGPTLANPTLPFVPNPNFGQARATLPGREIQLGLRWAF